MSCDNDTVDGSALLTSAGARCELDSRMGLLVGCFAFDSGCRLLFRCLFFTAAAGRVSRSSHANENERNPSDSRNEMKKKKEEVL